MPAGHGDELEAVAERCRVLLELVVPHEAELLGVDE